MKLHKLISAVIIPLLAVATVQADVVAGRWEKVETLPPGSAIIVSLVGGERLECTLSKIGPDEILLGEIGGNERKLPKSAILKIETAAPVRDRLRNGILIGMMIGAAGGIVSMAAYGNAKTNGPVQWGDEDGPAYLLGAALVGAGIGAATGAIVDASIKNREALYKAK